MNNREIQILLVEDDEVDIKLVKRSLKKQKIINPVHVVNDGIEALDFLRSQKIHQPYIVLLDLNLPRMNGIQCLNEIRRDQSLKQSVVFVLTTSSDEEDKNKAYNLNIAGYLVKSNVGEGFINAIMMLDAYWKIVEFPSNS